MISSLLSASLSRFKPHLHPIFVRISVDLSNLERDLININEIFLSMALNV